MNKEFTSPNDQHALAQRTETLAEALMARRLTLATAESCTGGWIAQACTDLAGSSRWFNGGIVSYSNAAKIRLLGVSPLDLEQSGAVSRPVAEAMALGAREPLAADLTIAVTGVAGPSGGTPDKPVGMVWFGWFDGQRVQSECCQFAGDRRSVRYQTVIHALDLMIAQASTIKG